MRLGLSINPVSVWPGSDKRDKGPCSWVVIVYEKRRDRDGRTTVIVFVHEKKNVFVTLPVKTVSILVPAELPRFENSRNVEMTASGKFARRVDDGF